MTPQFFQAKNISDYMKQNKTSAPIVLGGAHPNVMPLETLQEISSADFLIYGEGEKSLLELINYIRTGNNNYFEIDGLVWRRNENIIKNNPRPLIDNLDEIPFPNREIIDQSLYRHQSFLTYSSKVQTIYTSRGCYGKCVYCASGHKLKTRVRFRSIDDIIDEFGCLKERYDIRYLLIKDDNFTINKKRVKRFCNEFKKRYPAIKWHCMCRIDTVDEELLTIMKESGLNDIFLGIESGNDNILKKAGKNITKKMIENVVSITSKLNIRTYGAFIIGLPGDSKKTIKETIDFACSLPLTIAGFSILIPYPGTKVFEEYFAGNKCKLNYENFIASSGFNYVEQYTGIVDLNPKELPKYISRAQRKFFLRPVQMFRMLKGINTLILLGYFRALYALICKTIYLWKKGNK
jgi:radical SAM superfamily enzyme YgiQ (UPF0313 family)